MKIEVAIIELGKKYATLDQAFVASRENQKLGREIKKKARVSKNSPQCFESSKTYMCYNKTHSVPISDGKESKVTRIQEENMKCECITWFKENLKLNLGEYEKRHEGRERKTRSWLKEQQRSRKVSAREYGNEGANWRIGKSLLNSAGVAGGVGAWMRGWRGSTFSEFQ